MARAAKAQTERESTLESCLAEAKQGQPASVYLFEGDPFLAGRAARQLAETLIPEGGRDLNLVGLDPAASPAEVASELATGGLFGGAKAVVLDEPAFLMAREDAADAFARTRQMWSSGRQKEAVRRLLALVAKAGWGVRELDPDGEGAPSAEGWNEALGVRWEPGDREWIAAAARYARERDMKAGKDDATALEALLAQGLPPGRVLLVATTRVDARLPLAKKLIAMGRRVSCGVPREGTWGEERVVLGPVAERLLAGSGKRLDGAAADRLAELLGADARTLSAELGKLVAYSGERKTITREDVDAVVVRVAGDPFFALGNAVEGRDLARALAVLGRSIDDGASPFMLLGALAATVRRLLVESERGRIASRGRRLGSYNDWSTVVLPAIPGDELGTKKPYGFWMKYQASQRFSRAILLSALAELAEADVAMKRGADGQLLLERAMIRLLGEPGSA
jgi:DNA polymerase-3 subunit delta